MLSKTSSGSFGPLSSDRKAEFKPKLDVFAASSERKPSISALSRDVKPDVSFSNSKRTIGSGKSYLHFRRGPFSYTFVPCRFQETYLRGVRQ